MPNRWSFLIVLGAILLPTQAAAEPIPHQYPPPQQYPQQYAPPQYPGPAYGPRPALPYPRHYWDPDTYQLATKIKYRDGDPIPPGYHLEERPRMGPIITGYAVGGPPYLIGLLTAAGDKFDNAKGYLVVPVAGPWLTLSMREGCEDRPEDERHSCFDIAPVLLILDGVLQGAGGLLILIGYTAQRTWLIRDGADVSLTVRPMQTAKGQYGAALVGSF